MHFHRFSTFSVSASIFVVILNCWEKCVYSSCCLFQVDEPSSDANTFDDYIKSNEPEAGFKGTYLLCMLCMWFGTVPFLDLLHYECYDVHAEYILAQVVLIIYSKVSCSYTQIHHKNNLFHLKVYSCFVSTFYRLISTSPDTE